MQPSVLLVDDEPGIINAIRRAIRPDGYQIFSATNGADALGVLEQNPIDVVVSDYRMPGMSGTELLKQVRQSFPNIVRVMLTGEADMQAVIQAINEGAIYKFLTKPWCNENLRSTLKEAMAVSSTTPDNQIGQSAHAAFCNRLRKIDGPAKVIALELRNPSTLRLLSAAQLKQLLLQVESLATTGGDPLVPITQLDEAVFALAIDTSETQSVADFAQIINKPFNLDGHMVSPRFAVGYALGGQQDDVLAATTWLRDALIAVTATTFSGEATSFSNHIEATLHERHSLEKDMCNGLSREEFFLQVQPQVDGKTLLIQGAESLCRWRHPTRGIVSPLQFIDLAEQNGFIHELGEWVIQESCRLLNRLASEGIRHIRLGVNVSPRQFSQEAWIEAALDFASNKLGDPGLLEVEITESTVMDDPQRALDVMKRLKHAGISLAMDDFGTGQSSLALLNSLPVDALKFDRSLIRNVSTDAKSRTLFTRLLGMTQELGVRSIVEGVETEEQIHLCQSVGCDLIQGYAFFKPLDIDAFLATAVGEWHERQ